MTTPREDREQGCGRVALTTFGCKLNQYDSEMMLTQLRAAGYREVDDPSQADLCIVNTCSVTATAERKCRAALRRMRRLNPTAQVMAAGCAAERAPQALARIAGVDTVIGNREKEDILSFVGERGAIAVGETARSLEWTDGTVVDGLLGRTRAYAKLQDGCSQHCTYCIVPQLRGRGRSLPIPDAVARVRHLADRGFAEVVITGVALGTYGFDFGRKDALVELLRELDAIEGLQRLRLGSVEPWAVTPALLDVIAGSETICPHLHIPLQSCDDPVLKRMNRRYHVREIDQIFERAFELRDDWGFGADVIVGFPGESEDSLERTRSYLASSPLSYLHVFPFSSRPGTPATRLPDQVSVAVRRERAACLKVTDLELRRRFREKHIGRRCSVILEGRRPGDFVLGHAANYLDVLVREIPTAPRESLDVMITDLHTDGVIGTPIM